MGCEQQWGVEARAWRNAVFNRPVRSLSARGAKAIAWVANPSFPTGVQTSHSFCMNLTYILKDGVFVILCQLRKGALS